MLVLCCPCDNDRTARYVPQTNGPVPVQLIQVYAKVVNEQQEDDDEALFDAGFHILSPIIKLLDACSDLPATMVKLEELLTPMLVDMCGRNPEDVFEQVRAFTSSACMLARSPDSAVNQVSAVCRFAKCLAISRTL